MAPIVMAGALVVVGLALILVISLLSVMILPHSIAHTVVPAACHCRHNRIIGSAAACRTSLKESPVHRVIIPYRRIGYKNIVFQFVTTIVNSCLVRAQFLPG